MYRCWLGTTEVRYGTVWLLEFYGDVKFLALTMPTHLLPMPDAVVEQSGQGNR